MSVEQNEQDGQNVFQRVAEATHGVVTPANVMDAVALLVGMKSASKLDTWRGIAELAGSYLNDLGDGAVARATGTVSDLGTLFDPVGDKIKTGFVVYCVAMRRQVDDDLLATVVAYNLATAGATVYDWLTHDKSRAEVSLPGKRSMFAGSLALGLQIIGNKVAENDETAGRVLKRTGKGVGYGGLSYYGGRAISGYWRAARSDRDHTARKGLVRKVSGLGRAAVKPFRR